MVNFPCCKLFIKHKNEMHDVKETLKKLQIPVSWEPVLSPNERYSMLTFSVILAFSGKKVLEFTRI